MRCSAGSYEARAMMWIVRVALRRPYTFICGAILVLIAGLVAIMTTPVDIFPAIPLPVATVIWQYQGMSPEEMEQRVVTTVERSYSATVNDIEHIESQSLDGVAVIKVFFQPTADVATGIAELTAASQSNTRTLPPGITPPIILRFNATDVPILQIGVGSSAMSQANLNDYVSNFVRTPLATAQGSTIPFPYGGAPRLINVDLDLARLYAKGLSPSDVSAAINAENVILPAGSARLGSREYDVRLNSSPEVVEQLNDMPIKEVNGAMVYIRDVAYVRDGAGVQTNIVRQNGQHGTYMSVLKNGNASSLAVVNRVKAMLAALKPALPASLDIQVLVDQSLFVRASISGVIREALIAACLTALMILLFLGSWRSTLIIATSIPLAVLCSIIGLAALGQTLNVMTLSGLALAVGILVDDATVTIENINLNMEQGKEILPAIVDGAAQIATPAFVSTISISIVFVPMFFLSGPAAALFRPLAMAVVFAVLASYVLSRTIVPTMAHYLLAADARRLAAGRTAAGGGRDRAGERAVRGAVRALPERLPRPARLGPRASAGGARRGRRRRRPCSGAGSVRRRGLLPDHGRQRLPAPRAGARRDAGRADGADRRRRGARHPARDPAGGAESRAQQRRHQPQRHQPGDQRQRHAERGGRRCARPARVQPQRLDVGLRAAPARHAPERVPRGDLLRRAGGHREPGAESRAAGPARRPGRGGEQDGRLPDRHPSRGADSAHPRRGRRPRAAGGELPGPVVLGGPDPGAADGAHAAPGGEQPPRLAQLERADGAELLAQPAERDQLYRAGHDATGQNHLVRGDDQHSGDGARSLDAAAVRQPGDGAAPDLARRGEPLQPAAGRRRLRGPGPERSRRRRRGRRPGHRPDAALAPERDEHRLAGPGGEHAVVVPGAWVRGALRHGARVPVARDQLPVLARSVGDRHWTAGGARGGRVDALHYPNHVQRAVADGHHHGARRRHCEQRAAHHVRG